MDFLRQVRTVFELMEKKKVHSRMPPMSEELDQAVVDWLQEE